MRFAWQGFAVEHPEDWAPVSLQGNRSEGYVRIASPGTLSCQVRWKQHKTRQELPGILSAYRSRLEKDAKRAKIPFDFHEEASGERLIYRYSGLDHGRGAIFWSESCKRIFFLESVAKRKESILGPFRSLLDSFVTFGESPLEWWSLFGLELGTPRGLEVPSPTLQAGRTRIDGRAKGVSVRMERWGFGQELLARHDLSDWARSALDLSGAEVVVEGQAVTLVRQGSLLKPPAYGLVRFEEDRNQLVAMRVATKHEAWRPTWDWFRA